MVAVIDLFLFSRLLGSAASLVAVLAMAVSVAFVFLCSLAILVFSAPATLVSSLCTSRITLVAVAASALCAGSSVGVFVGVAVFVGVIGVGVSGYVGISIPIGSAQCPVATPSFTPLTVYQ